MSSIKIANAPCSWGVLEFGLDAQVTDCVRVLGEMAESGYAGTELGDWGFLPTEPEALRETLAASGLSMVAAFVPVELANEDAHQAGVDRALDSARLLAGVGESALIVLSDENGKDEIRTSHAGRIKADHGLTEARWQNFARGAEKIARAVRDETGGRVAFHPHCAGFVETPQEVDNFLRLTDPELVGLCLDTGHCTFGGGDAVQAIRDHADRIWHMHFKDLEPNVADRARSTGMDYFNAVASGVFCELGKGAVEFKAVVEQLERIDYSGWIVVEQDVLPGMGTPIESARRNRSYIESLGL